MCCSQGINNQADSSICLPSTKSLDTTNNSHLPFIAKIRPQNSTRNHVSPVIIDNFYEQFFRRKADIILTIFLILGQYAAPCQSFDLFERFYNSNFNHHHSLQHSPPALLNTATYRNYIRQFYNDPLIFLPKTRQFNSLSNDKPSRPSSSTSARTTSNSWSSMVTTFDEDQEDTLDAHVRKILVPRVSGTFGNVKVRNYIVDALKLNHYHVELDSFTDTTPIGSVDFANIIGYSNPRACRQLVLACHYDSKLQEGFLGATDSAVPCAMLLKLAETFEALFRDGSEDPKNNLGLMFIFFDGEEAFKEWSDTDSLYGSRHLAAKWEKQVLESNDGIDCNGKNELSRIEIFVLLDLIGSSDTSFVSYNKKLKKHYNNLQSYEIAYFLNKGLSQLQIQQETAFKNRFIPLDFVQDDHVPFKKRGVPILSLLAHPFPRVWHTNDDNYSAIDYPRTRRILHVLEEFVRNYPKVVST